MKEETCHICGEGTIKSVAEGYRALYFGHAKTLFSCYHACVDGCGIEYVTEEDMRLNKQEDQDFQKKIDEELDFAYEKMLFNLTEDLLLLMEHRGITKEMLARHLRIQTRHIEDVFSGKTVLNLRFLSAIVYTLKSELKIKVADESITHIQEGDAQ